MVNRNEKLGLFILRITLGIFLLLWGFDKIFAAESTTKIFEHFYFLSIGTNVAYIVGILEILLAVAIIIGFAKQYSYGLGMVVHSISTLSTYAQLLSPFGKNHLFIAAIPVLGGFIALYLMRDQDTLLAVDGSAKKRKR